MAITQRHWELAYEHPLHAPSLFGHFAATLVPGVERWIDGGLMRALQLGDGQAIVHVTPGYPLLVRGWFAEGGDLSLVEPIVRRWFDLDADSPAIDERLGADPDLAALVTQHPGVRLPGTVDPAEMALRVVFGQQVSTKAAATMARKFVDACGQTVPAELLAAVPGAPGRLFPSPGSIAELSDDNFPGMPRTRRETVRRLATALADGSLVIDPASAIDETRAQLHSLKGVGPWTVEMIALRGLGYPDAFPHADLGVLVAAKGAGLPDQPRALAARSEAWRPWRSYATQLLWASSGHEAAQMPQDRSVS